MTRPYDRWVLNVGVPLRPTETPAPLLPSRDTPGPLRTNAWRRTAEIRHATGGSTMLRDRFLDWLSDLPALAQVVLLAVLLGGPTVVLLLAAFTTGW